MIGKASVEFAIGRFAREDFEPYVFLRCTHGFKISIPRVKFSKSLDVIFFSFRAMTNLKRRFFDLEVLLNLQLAQLIHHPKLRLAGVDIGKETHR